MIFGQPVYKGIEIRERTYNFGHTISKEVEKLRLEER